MSETKGISKPPEQAAKILDVIQLLPVTLERETSGIWSPYYEDVFWARMDQMDLSLRTFDPVVREKVESSKYFYAKVLFRNVLVMEGLLDQLRVFNSRDFSRYVDIPDFWNNELANDLWDPDNYKLNVIARIDLLETPARLEELKELSDQLDEAVARYDNAIDWYFKLKSIAEFVKSYDPDDPNPNVDDLAQSLTVGRVISIDNGILQFHTDVFAQAFSGIPIERIRMCDNCERIFWLRRKHAELIACNESCSQVLRKQRSRTLPEETKKQYAEERRRKREKKREELEKKKRERSENRAR